MSEAQVFRRRSLNAAEIGDGLAVLDALVWPTPLGARARVYFARGATQQDVSERLAAIPGAAAYQVGPSVYAEAALRSAELPLGPDSAPLATAAPEAELCDDLTVILGQRHGEPADQVALWLRYHVEHHGLQAAVLVDRAEPGSDSFADDLEASVADIDGLQRLILVDAPHPMGQPGQFAIGHPGTAPNAKWVQPEPDPWLAPLGELLLFDLLKWRFLARASAVASLDPCDLLRPPEDGIPVFDAVRQSHTGQIILQGDHIYPWRVRKGHTPTLGDHICRSMIPDPAPQRWAVAPKRLGPENLWLPRQIVGATALADETASYDRCLAARFTQSTTRELTEKTTLVEDEALITRATEHLGGNPVRMPKSARPKLAEAPTPPPSGRTVIVTCMKNEGPFILEWLAFHRMIGVDDVLVYTNDCTDGTVELLDLLQDRGLVQRRDNPFHETGGKPQHVALDLARKDPLVQNAGWIACIDVDEFINIHVGEGTLADLYGAVPDANVISLTWRLFGNDDVTRYEDRFVTEQFTRCAPQLIRRPHQAWGFKSLLRNEGLFETFGVHRPKGLRAGAAARVRWVNGSGKPMPPRFLKSGWRSGMDSYGYDLVTLNHYSVRSAESFLVKRDRGRVNHVNRDQGEGYWFRMNNNAEIDTSIARSGTRHRAAFDELLQDPDIAAAHAACVKAHRTRIAELKADDAYKAFYDTITSDRLRQLSRLHRHFGMNVFLRGPAVIPDSVLTETLPPDFFFNTAPPEGQAAD